MARPKKARSAAALEAVVETQIERPSKLNRSERPKRVPINGLRDKLVVKGQEPGWHYCWVNEDNVPAYESALYEFVTHEVQVGDRKIDQASMIGGKIALPGGNGVTIFLMRCTEEDWKEEMALVDERTDNQEQSMRENLNNPEFYGKAEVGRGRKY